MKKLTFSKKEYIEKILKNEKTSTIRLGKRVFEIGEIVSIYLDDKKIADAVITNVSYMKLNELTQKHAIKDGFKNKKELIKALKFHYPKISKDDIVTLIEFKIRR